MTLCPINGYVLVKPLRTERKTPGGVHLPDTVGGSQNEGEIIAVAEDATEEVAVGDRVIYSEFGGKEVSIDGEEYAVLSSEDLLAKYISVDEIPE